MPRRSFHTTTITQEQGQRGANIRAKKYVSTTSVFGALNCGSSSALAFNLTRA
jgi:hypothetical protein